MRAAAPRDISTVTRTSRPSARRVPVPGAVHPHLAECDPDEQFEFGLDLMFRGVRNAPEPTASSLAQTQLFSDPPERLERLSQVLLRVVRRHDRAHARLPLATVGNTIAGANTPSSNSRRANACVRSSSPVITGVIGVSLAPVSNPSSCSPALNDAVFDHSRSSRSGSSPMTSSASMHAATAAGGALVENR